MLGNIVKPLKPLFQGLGFDVIRYKPYNHCNVLDGKLIYWDMNGTQISFFVADEHDLIQREHLHQRFYEAEELRIISEAFTGGVFVDIGANVGNHALYAALFMGASRVIAIEPNPAAYHILRVNIRLNAQNDKIIHHAVGLSDINGRASINRTEVHNLGLTELNLDDTSGAIEMVTGDALLSDTSVSFIKIDTEGMEMKALSGLHATIQRERPGLFIEVDDKNFNDFQNFLYNYSYDIKRSYKRYQGNENFLAMPR